MNESKIILKYVPIFSEIDAQMLARIEEVGIVRNYKKDMIILDEANEGTGLFIVTKGEVKVTRNDS
jgi:CRP-like cAMP-binding protein